MLVAVLLRVVPDPGDELEIDDNGTGIDREWVGLQLNEFDDHALEEAVLLKEAGGATVVALALAGEGAERQLQTAIAKGADRAMVVTHDLGESVDSRSAAHLFSGALEVLGADLVLTGVQTSEDLFGQLAPLLAGTMGLPVLNAVNGISLQGEGLRVTQEYGGGHSSDFEVTLPAVLGIQTASRPPRYVSGSKLRAAGSAEIEQAEGHLPDSYAPPGPDALQEPERGQRAEMLPGNADAVADRLVAILAERGLGGA